MDLTTEESNKIKENRKAEENLPTFFSAALNKEIAISRDFEGFLILSSKDTLQNAVGWLDKVLTINSDNIDRNELIEKAITFDAANAAAIVDEINTELGDFNEFREKFVNSKFSSVTEVGQIMSDLQVSFGELTSVQDRASHLIVLLNILKVLQDRQNINDKRQKQIESWNDSLSSY